MHRRRWSRRAVLAAGLTLLTAGCAGGEPVDTTTRQQPEGTRSTTETGANDSADQADGAALDRREANVVGLNVTDDDTGYTFDVTLHHDDEGEMATPTGGRSNAQTAPGSGGGTSSTPTHSSRSPGRTATTCPPTSPVSSSGVTTRPTATAGARCSSTCRPAPPARSPRAGTGTRSPRQRVPERGRTARVPPTAGITGRSRAVAPLSLQ